MAKYADAGHEERAEHITKELFARENQVDQLYHRALGELEYVARVAKALQTPSMAESRAFLDAHMDQFIERGEALAKSRGVEAFDAEEFRTKIDEHMGNGGTGLGTIEEGAGAEENGFPEEGAGEAAVEKSMFPIEDPAIRNLAITALAVLRTRNHDLNSIKLQCFSRNGLFL